MAPRRPKKQKKVLSGLQEQPKTEKIIIPLWLVFVLDKNLFPGLQWCNRNEEATFLVKSTHQRSNQWNLKEAAHCIEWSLIKNTYSYKKEIRVYKAAFRTALNSKGKPNKEQIKKIGKIRRKDGDWIKYVFKEKSFLSKEMNPFLQEYYSIPRVYLRRDSAGQGIFSSSNEGESSMKTPLPPFSAEFRTVPERQNLGQLDPTTIQKDVQSSVSKRTKTVRKRKYKVKKTKENATSTTSQNSPGNNSLLSEKCFSPINEAVKSPLLYENQLTPEPQYTDVHFKINGNNFLPLEKCFSPINEAVKSLSMYENQLTNQAQCTDIHFEENESQHFFSSNHEIYTTYTENQPCTPMSSYGDTQEAFPSRSSYISPSSPNSLNCIYNPQQNLFHHSMPNTRDQNECATLYHQLRPHYPEGHYQYICQDPLRLSQKDIRSNSLPPYCIPSRTSQDPTLSLEHLPYNQIEESLAFDLIEKRYPEILSSILETNNY